MNQTVRSLFRLGAAGAFAGMLAACSGGGGGGSAPPLPSAAAGGAGWAAANAASRSSRSLAAFVATLPAVGDDGEALTAGCPEASSAGVQVRCYVSVGARRGVGQIAPASSSGFYSPAQLQAAYALPSSTKGTGQTVYIVDAYDDPNAEADLGVYRSNYGLSPCTTANGCFRKLNQTGQAGPYPTGDMGWGQEISLDTQMVSAICPNCHIALIEANSSGLGDLGIGITEAVTLGGQIVSTSWGSGEFSGENGWDGLFDHPGVAITNSAGDGGYAAGTQYPAASPYVTAVGGTILTPASNARGWTEVVWPSSGGGCSGYETKPSWQNDTGCSLRAIADVAAVADSVAGYDSYESDGGGWYSFYGTSVSSPIIASTIALAQNAKKLTFASRAYAYLDKSSLHDIVKGNTGICSPAYLCTGEHGYDGPSGNGTPHGSAAF